MTDSIEGRPTHMDPTNTPTVDNIVDEYMIDSCHKTSDFDSSDIANPISSTADQDNVEKEDSTNTLVKEKEERTQDQLNECNLASVHEETSFDGNTSLETSEVIQHHLTVSSNTIKQVASDLKTDADSADQDVLAINKSQETLQHMHISTEIDERDDNTKEEASTLQMSEMLQNYESGSLLERWQQNSNQSNDISQTTDSSVEEISAASKDEMDDDKELLRGWSRDETEEDSNVLKMIRKAGVAVTGGALVAVGLPMIPMPTPGGVVVVGSGMALLATEFPAAQRALDRSRQGLAHLVGDESDDDEDKVEKKKKVARVADLVFQNEEMEKKEAAKLKMKTLLNPIAAMKETNSFSMLNKKGVKEFKERTVNATNGAKKNVKRFIRRTVIPLMERMSSGSSSTDKLDRDRRQGNSSMLRLKQGGTSAAGSTSTLGNTS